MLQERPAPVSCGDRLRRFRQVDDDVHLDVPLTLREALLGAEAIFGRKFGQSLAVAV